MGFLVVILMGVSFLFAFINGRLPELGAGMLEGAQQAVTLALGMTGAVCLWCGTTEIMRKSGMIQKLSRLFRRILCALFPEAKQDEGLRGDLAAAVSANLLGLGNAATPLSIRACTRLHEHAGSKGTASNSICMLVVLSAGSLQLIPSTVAAVRLAAGAVRPFDILPAVWLTTAASCATGVLMALLLGKIWGEEP